MAQQTVWSLSQRLLHWVLALSMIVAFTTHEGAGAAHEVSGYVALGAASLRLVMGFARPPYWRFDQFVCGPRATLAYARALWHRAEPHYLGHNPLGGWMVLALLADALATGFTGWLSITDQFWGTAWLQDLHSLLGHALLPLLVLHVAGVLLTSWRQRENLIASMLHGRKSD
jgi:cytochrome b